MQVGELTISWPTLIAVVTLVAIGFHCCWTLWKEGE